MPPTLPDKIGRLTVADSRRLAALRAGLAVIVANRHGIELPEVGRDAAVSEADLLRAVAFIASTLADEVPTGGPATLQILGSALAWVESGDPGPEAGDG